MSTATLQNTLNTTPIDNTLQVSDYNANRVKLSTDMADMCNMVKERVVKAEDCRIILDVSRARSAYIEIHDINLKLRQQYTKREANHNQLLACLKARPRCFDPFFLVCGMDIAYYFNLPFRMSIALFRDLQLCG